MTLGEIRALCNDITNDVISYYCGSINTVMANIVINESEEFTIRMSVVFLTEDHKYITEHTFESAYGEVRL